MYLQSFRAFDVVNCPDSLHLIGVRGIVRLKLDPQEQSPKPPKRRRSKLTTGKRTGPQRGRREDTEPRRRTWKETGGGGLRRATDMTRSNASKRLALPQ
jgi:hypothetical protein